MWPLYLGCVIPSAAVLQAERGISRGAHTSHLADGIREWVAQRFQRCD